MFYQHKKEKGTAADMLAAGLVILIVVFVLLFFMGFSKSIQLRLSYDNIAKKYLYRMESTGYLSAADIAALNSDIKNTGGRVISNESTFSRVRYGGTVTLDICIEFPNPVLEFLNKDNYFVNLLVEDVQTYHIRWEATAKW